MVVEVIPSPIEAQQIRCKAVMYGNKDNVSYRNEGKFFLFFSFLLA